MELTKNEAAILEQAIHKAVGQVKALNEKLADKFPSPATVGQVYEAIENAYWTTSFFTGLQYLSYCATGEESFKDKIKEHLYSFRERLANRVELDTHDLGFLYEYSALMAYKNLGIEAAADALEAAGLLMSRYHKNAGIIQAWGDLNQSEHRGRMIIDANMNLPLLYWASEFTGDPSYYNAAYTHVLNAQKYIMRLDNSTYHTYYFDPDSGVPLKGTTQQGYSDDSCWARGQAWAIYGFTLSYQHTKDGSLLKTAMEAADYFIEHLPNDRVCFWDLIFTDGDDQERDSSSAAIAACGLMALAQEICVNNKEKAEVYQAEAKAMIMSLIKVYTPTEDDQADGLILHSVYSKPHGKGVDEGSTWGDYYYMEALIRMGKKFEQWL